MEKIISKIAVSANGTQISVQVIPLKKKQNTISGFVWVEVGKKVLLESGQELELNLDNKSFYISQNEIYRFV